MSVFQASLSPKSKAPNCLFGLNTKQTFLSGAFHFAHLSPTKTPSGLLVVISPSTVDRARALLPKALATRSSSDRF